MNASQLTTFSARSADVGAALWPAVVLIASVESDASVTEPSKFQGELIQGAEQALGTLVARVRKSILPDKPAAYQNLRWKRPAAGDWDTTIWWIEEVTGDNPSDAEWRILCSPKN